ncbi:MAG TPA: hypothetical protein VKA09_02265 [Nitrososphaeraceae archaeon]|nr:hypothetical protein [Nitrososphaeraceae archaeon]
MALFDSATAIREKKWEKHAKRNKNTNLAQIIRITEEKRAQDSH